MAAKKKYYDLETEFSDEPENSGQGFSFLDWLKMTDSDSLEVAKKKEQQNRVIENFIQNAPKVRAVKRGEELMPDPTLPEESDEELKSEDIVSETLAQIYEEQGAFPRAAEVYRKLSLINPEKSDYFAARLKELKKKESEFKK